MAAVANRSTAGGSSLDPERSRLVERHVRLAEKIARTRCLWGRDDPDETRSDAFWGLTLAGCAFQPDKGSFASYAALRIEYAIRRGRQMRSGLPRSMWDQGDRTAPLSLNAPVREGGPELIDVLPGQPEAETGWLADALGRLPARECLVLKLRYYHGFTQSDVAPIIGRSQMQVSRIERAALAKLRDLGVD
jgi:RNA polymerase sigma factor (sigma-70 family)